jgi:raffinose/stachyose/melibiose transport system permease protein
MNRTEQANKIRFLQFIKKKKIGSNLVLCLWSALVLFPLWVMVINSFKDRLSIYKNPFWLPKTWNFSNYLNVLKEGDFLAYFKNSVVVVILSIFFVLVFGSLVAYAFANWKSRLSNILYFFFIAGMMLPIRIASIKLLEMVRDLKLINTIWSLIPIYVAMGLPIAVFILTEYMRQIPKELMEAAYMDGADRLSILIRIIVPLVRPALATVAIYNLVPYWNDLWFPLIFISDEHSKTLLLGVTRLFGQFQTDWSMVLAVLTLSALPVIILYTIMSRQFIKGLTAGATKG